jgi:hypothetical protein
VSSRRLLAVAAALVLAALAAAPAAGQPPQIANLQVQGGEASWHASNVFRLDWEEAPAAAFPQVLAYRFYDPQGQPLGPAQRVTVWGPAIEGLTVPAIPGAYPVEAWLEDAEGQAGPAARAVLRFDNAVPPPAAPAAPERWLGAHEAAVLQIGHPQGPLPVSGIRGYAVSLDGPAGSSPCAAPTRCSEDEVDLADGIADDRLNLGTLPEGSTVARVVAVSGAGVASPVTSATVRVDATAPQLTLQGLPGAWSDRPVQLTALASDQLSGMTAAGPDGPFVAIAVDGAAPTRVAGDRASAWVGGSGIHTVAYFGRDAAGNGAESWPGAAGPATATVRIDEEPPQVAFTPTQDPADPERIEAIVVDSLSGPSSGQGSVGLRPLGSEVGYRQLPTRITGGRLVARWDSDAYPAGKYEFLVRAYDAAGNDASGGERRGGTRMILANPVKRPLQLQAGFGPHHGARTAAYGRGARFGGRLLGASGASVAGLRVTVTETFAAGSKPPRRSTTARIAADGSFSTWLPPSPSRDVNASFAGTRILTRATSASVQLRVRSSVRLHASAPAARIGGVPVVFSGRIGRSGAERTRGLPVELQFRYPGAAWSEFRTVEADGAGRFRYAYRFSDDDSRGIRFQFRARVEGREGWPYEPSASRPIPVTGL